MIPGHELSGVITSIGKGVKSFMPGDRVVVDPNITCGQCEYCKGDLYAVGHATVSGKEMGFYRNGIAVKVHEGINKL